jgi:hypothetical protein
MPLFIHLPNGAESTDSPIHLNARCKSAKYTQRFCGALCATIKSVRDAGRFSATPEKQFKMARFL